MKTVHSAPMEIDKESLLPSFVKASRSLNLENQKSDQSMHFGMIRNHYFLHASKNNIKSPSITSLPFNIFSKPNKMFHNFTIWSRTRRRKKIRKNFFNISAISNLVISLTLLASFLLNLPLTSALKASSLSSANFWQSSQSSSMSRPPAPKNCKGVLGCLPNQFQCHKSCKCIDASKVCDNSFLDCGNRDISDELESSCAYRPKNLLPSAAAKHDCPEDSMYCEQVSKGSGNCLQSFWWCDNEQNCVDSQDEHPDLCGCGYGYNKSKDNDNICVRDSNCAPGLFTCFTPEDTLLCFHPLFVCDGKPDCPLEEDEFPSFCDEGCDSSESDCGSEKTECVHHFNICDDTKDCFSGLDEPDFCQQTKSAKKPEGIFECGKKSNRTAIYYIDDKLLCDGVKQCQDGSDESNCDTFSNAECLPTSCHHNCRKSGQLGVECYCDKDYTLAEDSFSCIPPIMQPEPKGEGEKLYAILETGDILELSLDSYGNSILDGKTVMQSNSARNSPVTISAKDNFVIVFNHMTNLMALDVSQMNSNKIPGYTLVENWVDSYLVTSLNYDSVHELLYWIEDEKNQQFSSKLKVANLKLPSTNQESSKAIEYSNFNRSTILQGRYDNHTPEDWRCFTSLVLDPYKGRLYLASKFQNGSGVIEAYNQDGSKLGSGDVLYFGTESQPENLKVDIKRDFLYFMDKKGLELKRIPIGNDQTGSRKPRSADILKQMNDRVNQRILTFEVLANQIIYSDEARIAFYSFGPLSNFNADSKFDPQHYSSMGAKIIQKLPSGFAPVQMTTSSNLPAIENEESNRNQYGESTNPFGCDDDPICKFDIGICLPRGQIRSTCMCPDHTLKDSRKNVCKRIIESFVVIATKQNEQIEKRDLNGENRVVIADQVSAKELYFDEDFLYWIDDRFSSHSSKGGSSIQRVPVFDIKNQKSSNFRLLPTTIVADLDRPFSLGVDSTRNVIFWSDLVRKTIEVAFLSEPIHSNVLLSREKSPRHLALDLLSGLIFWSEENSRSIWQANMDGSDVKVIVTAVNCWPDEIKFEAVLSQIYFSCRRADGKKWLYVGSAGETQNFEVPLGNYINENKNWCFTIFEQNVVIAHSHVKSYTKHNGEESDAVSFAQSLNDEIERIAVYKQEMLQQVSDPCEIAKCSQRCLKVSVSPYFGCTCFFGYKLSSDGVSCHERQDSDILLMSHDSGVKLVYLKDRPLLAGEVSLPGRKSRIGEFDFDPSQKHLYYLASDYQKPPEPIRRVHLLTGKLSQVYAEGEDVTSFALDKIGRKLYYAERFCKCIKVSELDLFEGEEKLRTKTIVSSQVGEDAVFGLMIDHNDGYLFWTQEFGNYRTVERIDLNGRDGSRKQITAQIKSTQDLEYPAIDAENNEIYYSFKGKIERASLQYPNGVHKFEDVLDKSDVFGISYLKGVLYFGSRPSLSHTSVHTYQTSSNDKYPSYNSGTRSNSFLLKELISHQLFSVNHLHAYTFDEPREQITNFCDRMSLNGHCEFMCLQTTYSDETPNKFSCECPDGVKQLPPGNLCEKQPGDFVLLPSDRIFYPGSQIKDLDFTFPEIVEPYSVDFLYRQKRIFIGTKNSGVFSMDFNGNDIQQVLPVIEDLQQIAIDWTTENLFWLSKQGLSVIRIGGDMSDAKTLMKASENRLKKPRALAVHPFRDLVFFSDYGQPQALIGKINMDGSEYQTIVANYITWPNSLAIDFRFDRLYWIDSSKHKIESVSLDGTQRRTILERHSPAVRLEAMTFFNGSFFHTRSFSKGNMNLQMFNLTKCEASYEQYGQPTTKCEDLHKGYFTTQSEYKPKSVKVVSEIGQPMKPPRSIEGRLSGCNVLANPRECDYICLSNPQLITCACPDRKMYPSNCIEKTIMRPQLHSTYATETPAPKTLNSDSHDSSPFAFELKLVMIVLVIIAVVVIILMIAILLLIKKHMIAAPPSPHRAIFTNHDNQPAATVILHTHQYPPLGRGGALPPFGAGAFNPRPPLGRQSRSNVYQDLPVRTSLLPFNQEVKFAPGRSFPPLGAHRFCKPSFIPGHVHSEHNPPPYSPRSESSRQGSTGGSSQGSSGNYQHLYSVQPNIPNMQHHLNRLAAVTGHPPPLGPFLVGGPGGSYSNATTPMTFSENSSEDSQQHSNDESSTA